MTQSQESRRIHFISGLPRAGSTLLAAILRQNPHASADMSSPLAGIFMAALDRMSGRNEFHALISEEQRERILRGIVESFYAHVPADQVVFDTNRVWCAKISALRRLFPTAWFIVCVRPLAEVLNSFERLAEQHPLVLARMYNYDSGGTPYSRVEAMMGPQGPVTLAFNALRSACYGQHAARLILLRYASLAGRPKETMDRLYQLIGERPFEHDFNELNFSANEFDRHVGSPGLHEVRGPVASNPVPMRLPPELRQRYAQMSFWEAENLAAQGVSMI